MNGTWVYDDQRDIWHLIWERNHPSNEVDGVSHTTAWCGYDRISEGEETRSGSRLGMMDTLHDECVRKSETLAE